MHVFITVFNVGHNASQSKARSCLYRLFNIVQSWPWAQSKSSIHGVMIELRYPSAMVAGPLRLLRWFVWSCWWRVVSPVLDILMSLAPKIGCLSVRVLGRSFHVAKFVGVLLKCCRLFISFHALFDCCPRPRLFIRASFNLRRLKFTLVISTSVSRARINTNHWISDHGQEPDTFHSFWAQRAQKR